VGFVPVVPAPINDLGLIRSPQITKSTQNLSIRYKTSTAQPGLLRRPLARSGPTVMGHAILIDPLQHAAVAHRLRGDHLTAAGAAWQKERGEHRSFECLSGPASATSTASALAAKGFESRISRTLIAWCGHRGAWRWESRPGVTFSITGPSGTSRCKGHRGGC
jgi:hypothetical protein